LLKLDKLAAERYVYMLKSGRYPAKLAAMPVSGVNMPVTTGGSTVIVAAEFLAMWMAARALAPDVPLTGMVISATLDMHGGQVAFGAYDALQRRIATAEFLRRWTGIEVSPSVGEWTTAGQTGMFAALEKAYVAMVVAAFTGFHPEIGLGHLESGLTLSPVQLLIEREMTDGVRFLQRPIVDEASLGLEVIEDIGFGFDRNFLQEDHTASFFRQASWLPAVFSRNGWTPEQDRQVKEKALRKVKELVAAYRKPTGREEPLARARAVVERARRELGAA
jgi:trimethylamine:corrinoid methyltransferase-like protein